VTLSGATECCGAGGLYMGLQPALARKVREKKVAEILASGARVVATLVAFGFRDEPVAPSGAGLRGWSSLGEGAPGIPPTPPATPDMPAPPSGGVPNEGGEPAG